MKTNAYYKFSPRNITKLQVSKIANSGENSFSNSSFESERLISKRSTSKQSFLNSIESELRKVFPNTTINSQADLKKSISSLVSSILSGDLPCKHCTERVETIQKLTNDIHLQNQSTFDEIEKLKEMKLQVLKYENLLKTKEKNLELQRSNLTENSKILDKKHQMIEKNMQKLEIEKDKIREERKKLDEEKKIFNKKFKKLDEQFFSINRELTERDSTNLYETNNKEKLSAKAEELNQISSEIKSKHKIVLEFMEKFTEMKSKLEENQKNFETLIKAKVQNDEEKESKHNEKLKKIKQKLKAMELKVKDLVIKNLDLSFIKTEEVTEKFITKPESEFEDKDLVIKRYKNKCEKLEESLFKKKIEIQELNSMPDDLANKAKTLEIKEKELKSMQDEIEIEKQDIAKTAKYLQDIFLQLEIERKSLGLEKKIVENEKEASEEFVKYSMKKDKKSFKSMQNYPELPVLVNRQSLHFTDEDLVIKIMDKKN